VGVKDKDEKKKEGRMFLASVSHPL
jgi:hypothetical protein